MDSPFLKPWQKPACMFIHWLYYSHQWFQYLALINMAGTWTSKVVMSPAPFNVGSQNDVLLCCNAPSTVGIAPSNVGKGPYIMGTPKILLISHAATSFIVAPPVRHPNTYINSKAATRFILAKTQAHPNSDSIQRLPPFLSCQKAKTPKFSYYLTAANQFVVPYMLPPNFIVFPGVNAPIHSLSNICGYLLPRSEVIFTYRNPQKCHISKQQKW
jgi:hypothetical protein